MKIPSSVKKFFSRFKKKENNQPEEVQDIPVDINNNNQNQEEVRVIRPEIAVEDANLMHQAVEENNIEADPLPVTKKKKNPFRKIGRYFGCIILSVSTFSQMIIGHFVPGRTGDRAADAVEAAGHNLAIIAHDVNDIHDDQDFYDARAALERSQRYPYIEGWARYLAETANTIMAFANRCTQYVATGKISVSMHDFILGVQIMLLFGSFVGIKASESTTSMIQSLTISSAASMVAKHYYPPTIIVSELSNHFFDFLSDRIIRPIIYFHADVLEFTLDKIWYGPVQEREVNQPEDHHDNQEWRARLGNGNEDRAVLCLI